MRTILLTLLILSSSASLAQVTVSKTSVSVETGQSKTSSGVESSSLSVAGFLFLSNGMTIEARNVTSQADKTDQANYGSPVSWQELGIGNSKKIGFTNVYGKVFLNMYEKTNIRYVGHAEELGVRGKFGDSPFSYQVGYRWTNAFDNEPRLKSRNTQIRTTLTYSVNKNISVYFRNQDQDGDTVQTSNNLGLSYSF